MPELHISGRFPYHNSSLDNNAIGASYDAISILMVTGRSFNSTNPTSVPTNTIDSESLLCGIVSFIIFFFLLCFGHFDCVRNLAQQEKTDSENSKKSRFQRVF